MTWLVSIKYILTQKDKSSELQASLIASGTGLLMILQGSEQSKG